MKGRRVGELVSSKFHNRVVMSEELVVIGGGVGGASCDKWVVSAREGGDICFIFIFLIQN